MEQSIKRLSLFGPGDDLPERLNTILDAVKEMSRTDVPQQLASIFGGRVGGYLNIDRFMALSRREEAPPYYRITRFTGWEKETDPWNRRDQLPLHQGGILGELLYGNEPRILNDPVVAENDPAYPYWEGIRSVMAIPQFDEGEAKNLAIFMEEASNAFDESLLPEYVWTFNLFSRAINARVLNTKLRETYEMLDREFRVIADIQRSLLPKARPEIPTIELAVHYDTPSRAGGDYYDFFELSSGKWGILIADVCGHGASAAVLMAITHAIAHSHPRQQESAAGFLEYLNRHIYVKYTRDSRAFVTAFYAVYDPRARAFTYASAGHDPPRIYAANGSQPQLMDGVGSLPLGIELTEKFCEASCRVEAGSTVVFYTDGITERRRRDRALFGVERMDQAVGGHDDRSVSAVLNRILHAAESFADGVPGHDDQTLVVASIS